MIHKTQFVFIAIFLQQKTGLIKTLKEEQKILSGNLFWKLDKSAFVLFSPNLVGLKPLSELCCLGRDGRGWCYFHRFHKRRHVMAWQVFDCFAGFFSITIFGFSVFNQINRKVYNTKRTGEKLSITIPICESEPAESQQN